MGRSPGSKQEDSTKKVLQVLAKPSGSRVHGRLLPTCAPAEYVSASFTVKGEYLLTSSGHTQQDVQDL